MSASAWLRFAELSLLAAWLAWRVYRPGRGRSAEAWLLVFVAAAAAAQLLLEAQAATDPYTPLAQVLPVILATPYGGLSVAIVVLSAASAVWLRRAGLEEKSHASSAVMAVVLLLCSGAATAGAADAVSAAASTGEITMSPTLAVPSGTTTTPNPYANDPASAARGLQVYQQYCLTCHGLNGDGNGPAVAGLRLRPPTFRNPQHFLAPGMDGAHFWVIQHGDSVPGGMPSWQGTLTDQQIWDALDYIKQLAAGRPTASLGSSPPGGSAARR